MDFILWESKFTLYPFLQSTPLNPNSQRFVLAPPQGPTKKVGRLQMLERFYGRLCLFIRNRPCLGHIALSYTK